MRKKKYISYLLGLIVFLVYLPIYSQIDTISLLGLWLRSDTGVVIDLGGHVKQWKDLSLNQFLFVQNDSLARPLYGTAYGKPVLIFDGINDFYDGGNILSLTNQGTTIFLLGKINSANGSFLAKSLAGNASNRYALLAENNKFEFLYQDDNLYLISNSITNIYYLWTIEIKNSNNKIIVRKNGIPIDSVLFNGSFNMSSSYNFIIGAYNNSSGTVPPILFLNGEIAEIIFINKNINTSTITLIEKYLMDKYAPPVRFSDDTVLSQLSFCPYVIKPQGYYTSYIWNDNSTNDSLVVSQTGVYSVTVTDIFGRQSFDSIYVQFPISNIEHIQFLCDNDSIILQTGLTYPEFKFLWQNGDTLPFFTVYSPGKYYVQITDQYGCTYFSDTIFVQADSFQYENVLPDSISICLGDTLFAYHAEAISYSWSTGENISFILPQQENWYYVTLTNSRGCKLIDSCFVHIKGQKPQPSIIVLQRCSRQNTIYRGISTGSISQWKWVIEDTISYNGQNIVHLYSSPGIYHTVLHVVDSNTCEAFAYSIDTIYDTPIATFEYIIGCNGQNTLFTSTALCSDSIYSYLWNINGQTYTGNIIQESLNQGNFLIVHKIVSEHGCSDSTLEIISTHTQQPIKATINFPNEGLNIVEDTILFSWNNFNQLSLIEISNDINFMQVLYRSPKLVLPYQKVNFLPLNDTLYWRIWTYNICNDSIVSNVYTFSRFNEFFATNVKLSLSADKGVIDSLNWVKSWKDFSPNQYNFIQPHFQFSPRLEFVELLNNKPVISFDGMNDYLYGGNILNLTLKGTSIFVIAKTNTSSGCIFAKSLLGNALSRYSLLFDNGNDVFLYHDNNPGMLQFSSNHRFNLWSIIIKNATNKIKGKKNETETDQISINGSFDMSSNYDFLIGAYNNSYGTIPPTLYLNGSIAEIIMYDTSLIDQQQKIVEKYLMDKYAPPVLLPADTELALFCPFTIKPKGKYISYLWNTGNTEDSIVVTQSGIYSITVTDIFGRQSSDSIEVIFPSTKISDTVYVCYGDSALIISALDHPFLYQWSTGDNKHFKYVKEQGWYYLTITDLQSCSIVDSFYVKIDSLSIMRLFSQDSIHLCSGNALELTSLPYSITSYIWQPSGSHNSSIIVAQSGLYSVQVIDEHQCKQKDSIYVHITGIAPEAAFECSHTCLGQSTTLSDLSYTHDTSQIIMWMWIIGNDTLWAKDTSYVFLSSGKQVVTLLVKTNTNCIDKHIDTVLVYPLPQPDFDILYRCSRHFSYFINKSNITDGLITEYIWNYGDGTYDTTGIHVFLEPGEYYVQLTAISDQGCRDSIQKTIEIKPTPFAGFDLSPSCVGSYTYFVDTSRTETYNPIIQWLWDFGDQHTSSLQHPNHQYNDDGVYTIKLYVKALNGCDDTTSRYITVSSKPIANFGYDKACVGQPIVLYDSTTITNGNIVQWQWYLGNNLFSNQQNPVLTVFDHGNYPITVIVNSNTYCSDTITKLITVYPLPNVSFDAYPMYGAVPLTVSFSNLSDEGLFLWTFGDGGHSTYANPVHIFSDTGTYKVCLKTTNEYGCSDQFCKNILVVPNVVDIVVEKIFTQSQNQLVKISALISNQGSLPIEKPQLALNVDGRWYVTEIMNDTLFMGEKIWYTFNSFLPLTLYQPKYLCVKAIELDNEQNITNNEQCKAFTSTSDILSLYPNPANEALTILLYLTEKQQVGISVYSITGKEVFFQLINVDSGISKIMLDTDFLSQGMYILQIKTKEETFIKKFIKQ